MLILASASPRRRQILEALGVEFVVVVPEVEELRAGAAPDELVLENARRKALAGLRAAGKRGPALGVDTEVVLDGKLLGKPESAAEARRRLAALSGRTHEVLSGLVLVERGAGEGEPVERRGVARSVVTFRPLEAGTIELYLASGEWRDRAGGYAVQGLGSVLLERLEGDLSNVIGLPVGLLLELAPGLIEGLKL